MVTGFTIPGGDLNSGEISKGLKNSLSQIYADSTDFGIFIENFKIVIDISFYKFTLKETLII